MNKLFLLISLLLFSAMSVAETQYVTDQFKITMRSGPSTSNKILRMLPSGAGVRVLSADKETGYSKVTVFGQEGYVLTHQLQTEPSARQLLAEAKKELQTLQMEPNELRTKLQNINSEYKKLSAEHKEVLNQNSMLEQNLQSIRHTASEAINVKRERDKLVNQVTELSQTVETLQLENAQLVKQQHQQWFIIGAAVLFGGIVLGLLLPHIRLPRKKRGSWDSL